MGVAVVVKNVKKTFKLPHQKQNSVKGLFVNLFNGKRSFERQTVLKDISFEIPEGEFFGIVGRNGSGKSTLLKMLAGIYEPNKGHISINGKLTPFIELGVGFNPNLTGRENVYLNGALLGFNRKEMDEMYDEIVDFAELHKFMDQKLKNYSSGMQVRLAFSIAIRAKSEILLLDEVLAVGDALFQKKCYDYFKQLKKEKRTVVFVSHDTSALLEYCDSGILIEKGSIVKRGKMDHIVSEYNDILNAHEVEDDAKHGSKSKGKRWGTGEAQVTSVEMQDALGKPKSLYGDKDTHFGITATFKALKTLKAPVFGVTVTDASGERIITSNTLWSRKKTQDLSEGESITVTWLFPNVLNTGTFSVSPAIADETGSVIFDWREDFTKFKVRKETKSIAYINTPHEIKIV